MSYDVRKMNYATYITLYEFDLDPHLSKLRDSWLATTHGELYHEEVKEFLDDLIESGEGSWCSAYCENIDDSYDAVDFDEIGFHWQDRRDLNRKPTPSYLAERAETILLCALCMGVILAAVEFGTLLVEGLING